MAGRRRNTPSTASVTPPQVTASTRSVPWMAASRGRWKYTTSQPIPSRKSASFPAEGVQPRTATRFPR